MRNINYPVGDFLVRLKNASKVRKLEVEADTTKFVKAVALALKKQGYLESVEEKKGVLKVRLAVRKKEPILMDIKLISKPGLRVYKSADELSEIKRPTIIILSTPKGVMSAAEAVKNRLGGELIAEIL